MLVRLEQASSVPGFGAAVTFLVRAKGPNFSRCVRRFGLFGVDLPQPNKRAWAAFPTALLMKAQAPANLVHNRSYFVRLLFIVDCTA